MSTTIRVNKQTRDRFARLADATGRPMSQLVDEAAEALERRLFFEKLVLTQRKPRPRGGGVRRALEPAGAGVGGARLQVEQEAEHPADFE